MLRLVRSAWRTADRFIQVPSSGIRLKPLGDIVLGLNLKGGSSATQRSLSSSATFKAPAYAHRSPPLQSTLSLSTRVALGRPLLSAPHLPRAPMLPRSVTQVGLGTARNFSSSRHIFQNIVDNVPITTRALWEAEWEIKTRKAEKRRLRRQQKQDENAQIADKVKDNSNIFASSLTASSIAESKEDKAAALSHYFTANHTTVEGVTTFFTVPLYPKSERRPLPSIDGSTFLPITELKEIHNSHAIHLMRVSTIFSRLDEANVWSKGAECACFGGPQSEPLVTSLQVVFRGWTKAMVLEAIGEAGMGWCELEEVHDRPPDVDPVTPRLMAPMLDVAPDINTGFELDPAVSFVLPTIDFSSDFIAHTQAQHHSPALSAMSSPSWTTRPSSPMSDGGLDAEGWGSDGEEQSPRFGSFEDLGGLRPQSSLGFSFDFLSRGYDAGRDHLAPPF